MDGFTLIAEPARRAIVDRLRLCEHDVGTLVSELQLSQPLVSKHLRVLRDAGVVDVEVAGKRRVYRLAERPLPDVMAWVEPYVERWNASFDRLAEALEDENEEER
ncbi:metalloregulator ArsR/SmtB family transcription factor [Demequina capsici]|uniref:Metalloregulator ArsR/SmtB family transcription factor n=1 Tax=Demequina capsici TaxID=3075620 RepID=A0AA96FEZ7_9MICO|nr:MULTISPECIES: metalloregulator ArsR/SmtB family transcription factor [unclassified Demequina]WNM25892.1 metalloregulator ArsR/SmtB family transcription factor [Demequina sp. OYTSA14]WNM28788.1 metalloregulator ArsR/SmtB family transcription factor [Demequina sp. PMTSA13]